MVHCCHFTVNSCLKKPSIVLRHPDKTNCSLILEKKGEEGEERGEIEGEGGGGGREKFLQLQMLTIKRTLAAYQ